MIHWYKLVLKEKNIIIYYNSDCGHGIWKLIVFEKNYWFYFVVSLLCLSTAQIGDTLILADLKNETKPKTPWYSKGVFAEYLSILYSRMTLLWQNY